MKNNNLFNSPKILWEESSSVFLDKNKYPEIPGVSKADLTALLVWLKIKELKKDKFNISKK